MRRLTLSQALILAIVVALLPVVVFAVWQGVASRTYAEGLIRERLLATARANAALQGARFMMVSKSLEQLLGDPSLATPGPRCSARLRSELAQGPDPVVAYTQWNANRTVRCGTVEMGPDFTFAFPAEWERASAERRLHITPPVHGRMTNRLVMIAIQPQFNASGVQVGAVTAGIDLTSLNQALARAGLPANAVAAAATGDGRIVASSGPAEGLSFDISKSLGESDGWIYSSAPLVPEELYLIYAEPRSNVFTGPRNRLLNILAVPLLAILVSSIAMWFAVRMLVLRWLSSLSAIAANFARGDFRQGRQNFDKAPAELARLGLDLENMAKAIAHRDGELIEAADRNLALAREVNHRVKNNLQLVMSLIAMQSVTVRDAEARAALEQTRARIGGIGIIHKLLYDEKRGRLGKVNAQALVEALCAQQRTVFANGKVDLACCGGPGNLPLDLAVPTSLFIVEAVSHAYLNGFAGGSRPGRIHVDLGISNDVLQLRISHDAGIIPSRDGSDTGMALMNAYIMQLNGEMAIEQADGLVTIALDVPFPHEQDTGDSEPPA